MRIFITGATGYLGFHFTNVAVSQGHHVLCLHRPTSVSLFDPIIEEHVSWINDDDPEFERKVSVFAPDVLFHAAWSGVGAGGAVCEGNLQKSKASVVVLSDEHT